MGGPVTYSQTPFASTVLVGDNNGAASISGAAPTPTPIEADLLIFAKDDIDDGTPEGRARAENYVREQVANGNFNQQSINEGDSKKPSQIDNTGGSAPNLNPANCDAIHGNFTMSTLIAPGITLGNFIKDYPAIVGCKQKSVPAQCGLNPDQIVCNLSQLANNAWIPLKAQYPDMIMTNSLRLGDKVGAGPHGTGQAMDVQFNRAGKGSIPPKDYFERAQWIKTNIAYDQMILEYSTERGFLVAWIHVSIYKDTGDKVRPINRVLTMMNHKVTNVGLANLG